MAKRPEKLTLESSNAATPPLRPQQVVDSPVERGDVSPNSGNLTFELLPAAVVDGKPKKQHGSKRRKAKRGPRKARGRGGSSGKAGNSNGKSSAASDGGVWDAYAEQVALPGADVVRRQLEFRFSPEMLSSDTYLRRNMDRAGYVPVWIVAQLGEFAQWGPAILAILRAGAGASEQLAYDADTDLLRLVTGWEKWLFPPDETEEEEDALWGSQWDLFGAGGEYVGEAGEGEAATEDGEGTAAAAEGAAAAPVALRATASEFVPQAAPAAAAPAGSSE